MEEVPPDPDEAVDEVVTPEEVAPLAEVDRGVALPEVRLLDARLELPKDGGPELARVDVKPPVAAPDVELFDVGDEPLDELEPRLDESVQEVVAVALVLNAIALPDDTDEDEDSPAPPDPSLWVEPDDCLPVAVVGVEVGAPEAVGVPAEPADVRAFERPTPLNPSAAGRKQPTPNSPRTHKKTTTSWAKRLERAGGGILLTGDSGDFGRNHNSHARGPTSDAMARHLHEEGLRGIGRPEGRSDPGRGSG